MREAEAPEPCGTCHGRGTLRCGRCRNGKVSCGKCQGTGRLGGRFTCDVCDGAGSLTCTFCHGRGDVPCSICDGRGYHG